MNLSKIGKVTRVSNAVAAGTTDVDSSSVDMTGFSHVMFIVEFGAITSGAVTSVHAEQSADDTNFDDLEGTSITVADDDDNGVVILDIKKSGETDDEFIRCVVDRGTQNAVVDGIVAIQYGARELPVTHDATTVIGSEFHAEPDEGTV